MTNGRKRWWRAAAIATVGGVAVTGGWFGLVRAKGQPAKPEAPAEATNWTRSTTPAPPAPTVAEIARTAEPAPPTGPVTPAGATLPPIPLPGGNGTSVAPAIPVAPPVVPSAPLSVPAVPAVPPVPTVEPASGPRLPDPAFTGGDKSALPAVPPVPSLPPTELPPLPVPSKAPEAKPLVPPGGLQPMLPAPPTGVSPMPVVPPAPGVSAPVPLPLPLSTAEPPKAPVPPVGGAPMLPAPPAPGVLPLPQPVPLAPSLPPAKPADPVQPMLPTKPDSDLKPINPGNTLNPTVAPAVPIVPGSTGREPPALPVDRPRPMDSSFHPTDKYIFPVPSAPSGINPLVPHQRDAMLNLTTTAAITFLGGALLAVEKANAPPAIPPSAVIPMPGAIQLKGDEKSDIAQLKTDLAAANKKIEDLEKQVKRLTELLTGKKDELGLLVNPNEPGAVEEIKRLKDKIATLEGSLKEMKGQTALRPAVVPEVKPRGTVKVVNEYPVEISMVINDKSYRIAPGTKVEVEVPAGDFTYQLLQSGAGATKSVIKDKETVTLRIK
jgi:hypothetical protein